MNIFKVLAIIFIAMMALMIAPLMTVGIIFILAGWKILGLIFIIFGIFHMWMKISDY